LNSIYKIADESEAAVGALTTENRDVWANVRKELIDFSPNNKTSLDCIGSACFIVCLDDSKPITKDEHSKACWHGDGKK
jgi:carnitine O-acetyltransferase